MENSIIVEKQKAMLFNYLEKQFNVHSISAVSEMTKGINSILAEWLLRRIVELSPNIFLESNSVLGKNRCGFQINRDHFEIQYTLNDFKLKDSLSYAVVRREIDPPQAPEHYNILQFDLVAGCQYRYITFSIDPNVKVNSDLLRDVSTAILAAGHVWLANRISYAIKSEISKSTTVLYDYMEMMCCGKIGALDGLVFSCLINGKDFVVLDDEAAAGALRLASGRASRFRRSAGGMTLQLFREVVNVSDSAIMDACESSERFIRIDLSSNPKYYKIEEELFDSLQAIWGKSVTCYPVVKNGDFKLVSFFPSDRDSYLLPLHDAHHEILRDIAIKEFESIRSHLTLLEKALILAKNSRSSEKVTTLSNQNLESVGGAGGAFFGELIGRILKSLS